MDVSWGRDGHLRMAFICCVFLPAYRGIEVLFLIDSSPLSSLRRGFARDGRPENNFPSIRLLL